MLFYALSRFVGLGVVHFSYVLCVVVLRGVCLLFGSGKLFPFRVVDSWRFVFGVLTLQMYDSDALFLGQFCGSPDKGVPVNAGCCLWLPWEILLERGVLPT